MPDDVPSARRLEGVNAGVLAANRHRPSRHTQPRRCEPWCSQTRVEIAQIREAGGKPEKINFIFRFAVQATNSLDAQLIAFSDTLEVRSVINHRNFVEFCGR